MSLLPKTILACLDPDGLARPAMHEARLLADQFGSALHYCQVVQQSRGALYLVEPLDPAEAERTGRRTFEMYGVPTGRSEVHVRQGNPAKEIVGLTFDVGADLLVLGRHRTGTRTAGRIVGLSDVPVLVHKGDTPSYRSILVACDLSGFSDLALRTGAEWAGVLGAAVSAVHVFEPPDYAYGGTIGPERARDREHARMTESLRHLGQGGLVPTLHRAEGDPVAAILQVADEIEADLVVVGSHGRTGLSRLLLGSVAERILEHEHTSVLVVRGPPPAV